MSNPWAALEDEDGDWEDVKKKTRKARKQAKKSSNNGSSGRTRASIPGMSKKQKPKKKKESGPEIPAKVQKWITEFKKLAKKSRQIEDLALRQGSGQKMNKDQLKKLASKDGLEGQLEILRNKIPEEYLPKQHAQHVAAQPAVPLEVYRAARGHPARKSGGISVNANNQHVRRAAAANSGWICEMCSYTNGAQANDRCEMCGYVLKGSKHEFLNEMTGTEIKSRAQNYQSAQKERDATTSNPFELLEQATQDVPVASGHRGKRGGAVNLQSKKQFPTLPQNKKIISRGSSWGSASGRKKKSAAKAKGVPRWQTDQPCPVRMAAEDFQEADDKENAPASKKNGSSNIEKSGASAHPAAGTEWDGMDFTAVKKALKKLQKRQKTVSKVVHDLKLGLTVKDEDREVYDEHHYTIKLETKALVKILDKMMFSGWLTSQERSDVLGKLQKKLSEFEDDDESPQKAKLEEQYSKLCDAPIRRASTNKKRTKKKVIRSNLDYYQVQEIQRQLKPLVKQMTQVVEWERRWNNNTIILNQEQFKKVKDKKYLEERIQKLRTKLSG